MNDNTEPASLTAALTTLTVTTWLTGIWLHALTNGLTHRTGTAFAVTGLIFAALALITMITNDT